jgi:hypothetical protein
MHHFIARVLCVIIAALALVAFVVLAAGAEACWQSGHTGEGFPVMSCEDGATYYVDMDGDGLSQDTVGRWVEIGG